MQRAIVLGTAVAPAKHETMEGSRLLIVQPLGPAGKADGEPYLVVDPMGAGVGQVAIISSDGRFAQETLGKTTPVRFTIVGLQDEK
jgi:Carbon dioxide concentrating mechanism/carboxysome shell protein